MKTKKKIIKSLLENKEPKTIKQYSKIVGADYRIVHTAMQRLIQEGAINLTKVGNASLCSIKQNYFSPEVFEVELQRKKEVLANQRLNQVYKDILRAIGSTHFTLLLSNLKKNNPEINLTLITNDTLMQKRVSKLVDLIPLPIKLEVYSEKDYRDKKYSEINEVVVIFHGIESYYHM